MDNEQITTLAREYAEECAEEVGVMFNPQNWACSKCEIETKAVIIWLLRRFSLVEKSKLEEGYKSSKHYFEHTDSSNPTQKQYFWGRMCAIESLFPEIGKEVEG